MSDPEHADLRARMVELLENGAGNDSLKSRLGLPKPQGSKKDYALIIDVGGDGEFKGNATAAKLRKVLGADFEKLSPGQLSDIVDDLLEYEKPAALAARLVNRYQIAPAKAVALVDVTLEVGYMSFSRKAINRLLPLLESGRRLASLKDDEWRQLFPNRNKGGVVFELLPPVLDKAVLPQLRNPVVCRGLTELRKVVNALIRQYGKPERVRIELARDLKRSRKQRERLSEQNDAKDTSRDAAQEENCEEIAVRRRRRQRLGHSQGPAWPKSATGNAPIRTEQVHSLSKP